MSNNFLSEGPCSKYHLLIDAALADKFIYGAPYHPYRILVSNLYQCSDSRANALFCGVSLIKVAQFILDDAISDGAGSLCRIICTQPRRISAISVSLPSVLEWLQK